MNKFNYGMNVQVVPVLAPVDIAGTATNGASVKISNAHHTTFEIDFGVITGDTIDVTVLASTAASTSGDAVAFTYRLSGAVGSDTWGAVTTADTTGVGVTASDDNKVLLIEVDHQTLDGYTYLTPLITPGGSASVCLIGITAKLDPRYPQLDQLSSS